MRIVEWAQIASAFLPYKKEYRFPQATGLLRKEIDCHASLSAQGINCLNQLLEELNDQVQRTKRVVESLRVLPSTSSLTYWLRGLNNSPPYSL